MNSLFPCAKRCKLTVAITCLIAGSAGLSQAQQLEEIVVTAQKRSQNLQDVPIALSVYDESFIESTGIRSIADLEGFTPGLETGPQFTQPSYTIRGIGTSDFGLGADPAVGVYIDGVYVGRSGGAELPFSDIALIEVLKGPQGTLFGRNTAAGAIQVKTYEPSTASVEGKIRVRMDNFNQRLAEGMLNVPVTDDVALRFNAIGNAREGTQANANGRDLLNQDDVSYRVSALWAFNEDGQVRYTYDNTRADQDAAARVSINDVSPDGNDPFGKTSNDTVNNQERRDLEAHSIQLTYDFDDISLEYVASYREFDTLNRQDEDGFDRSIMPGIYSLIYLDTANIEESEQHYHEFRLVSDGDVFQWTAGVSYYNEDGKQRSEVNLATETAALVGAGAVPPNRIWTEAYDNTLEATSYAAFGDITWSVTEKLNLTAGIRYTQDEKDFTWLNSSNNQGLGGSADVAFPISGNPVKDQTIKDDDSWSNVSPRFVVDYRWTDNMMTFLSLAQGYKAGGFNALAQNANYDEETVDNAELGIRSEWFKRRVMFNASIYHYKYNDRQGTVLTSSSGVAQYLTTTGDAKGTGFDMDVSWLVVDGLTATLNYGYLDAEWTDFQSDGLDLSGEPLETPEHQAVAMLDYIVDLGEEGSVQFHIDHSYSSEPQLDSSSFEERFNVTYDTLGDSRQSTNARISWMDGSGALEVALWSRNLLDEEYVDRYVNLYPEFLNAGINTGATMRNEPRSYGAELIFTF